MTNQVHVNSDAFAGGFVAGIVEGKSLDESIDQGHWLAKLSIQELGPQYVRFQFAILLLYEVGLDSPMINEGFLLIDSRPPLSALKKISRNGITD